MTNAETNEPVRQELARLVTYLCDRREFILENWHQAALRDPELTTASTLTRSQFNDHIPGVLDGFARRLSAWPDRESEKLQQEDKEKVIGHGMQRWQQGYRLREVTGEWGKLQICLMEELEAYSAAHPDLLPMVMPTARKLLASLCWDGISESVNQYWRLHQAEAAGHANDLEQALATLNELERARAEGWREAAHDLRGSVNMVTGAASILQSEGVPEPVRMKFFNMLQSGVSSLHEMLVDLMSLARLEAGQEQRQIAPFDAAVLLRDICSNSTVLAEERGLYLKLEGPDSLPVEGDKVKVQRILQNLLLNALKYTKRGGVTVLWEYTGDEGTKEWFFCVQDTGPGLDAGLESPLTRGIYEATQRSHEAEEFDPCCPGSGITPEPAAPTVPAQSRSLPADQLPGEGVGLSIVKRLCELLDASLELETSPGTGSTFRVILPRTYEK